MTSPNWWQPMPFVRLIPCLIAGIILQQRFHAGICLSACAFAFSLLALLAFARLRNETKFRFRKGTGVLVGLMISSLGAMVTWQNNITNSADWFGHHYGRDAVLVARIVEPLSERPRSWKTFADAEMIIKKDGARPVEGKIILYLKKDPRPSIRYGDRIIISEALQEIRNSGNPGSFDYRSYCFFQGITHQAYLREPVILPEAGPNRFYSFILGCRQAVTGILNRSIAGEKELGLAEALLIGYKDDLDKGLVQAYSNTGVVHVIAISGLHLGLIYWLLVVLTKPMQRRRGFSWLRLLIILVSLWLFSIIAGAQPSILRSAVMFSFMAWGKLINRRTSAYNTLALSAFLLLCYDPFWLWDAGFQLSYAAVLSIISFYKPVYAWLYFPNKLLDTVWKLVAVTLSAQLLTLPISMYHFHQFPMLFLFTNLVAVPLSTVVLFGEIVLCAGFFIHPFALALGRLLSLLIRLLNNYVERMDAVSFAVWGGISINAAQAVLLTGWIVLFCCWLMGKKLLLLRSSLFCMLGFTVFRTISFLRAAEQKKIVVYNIPGHCAIDIINGRRYHFLGDEEFLKDQSLRNFHLRPCRILHRVSQAGQVRAPGCFTVAGKKILVTGSIPAAMGGSCDSIHILVLSGNPRLYLTRLARQFRIGRVVIDSSVPGWKAALWKKDADALGIPCHDVATQGAFARDL